MRTARVLVAALLATLVAFAVGVPPSHASAQHPTVDEVSKLVMCPTCEVTLDRSDSPAADRMRRIVRERVRAGDTRQQVLDHLVSQYGGDEGILAVPPPHGRGLVVWGVPLAAFLALLVGAGVTMRGWLRRRPATSSASGSAAPVASSAARPAGARRGQAPPPTAG